jgi:hypothetical protein
LIVRLEGTLAALIFGLVIILGAFTQLQDRNRYQQQDNNKNGEEP